MDSGSYRAQWILDSPEGDLLEYGLTLFIGDIKAVEEGLIGFASAQDWRLPLSVRRYFAAAGLQYR